MSKLFRFSLLYIIIGLSLVETVNATPVFINEIHYDNAGSDVNEGVEIAGPANTDLSGWQLVLYNGGNGQPYSTISLAGIFSDLMSGFGVLSFAYSGIQNGSPDGVALVDSTNQLIQFLSYEGVIDANSGVAAGQRSIDILVQEPANTLVGSSLQLSGAGSAYEDFQWGASSPESFGAINGEQRFLSGEDAVPTPSVPVPSSIMLWLFALLMPLSGGRSRQLSSLPTLPS